MTDSEQSYINTSDSDDETGTSSSDSAESAASWAGRAKKAARKPNLAQFNTDDEESDSDSDSDSEQEQVKLKRRVSAGAGTGGSKGVPSLAAKVPVANQAPIERLLERQTKHGQEEFFVKFRVSALLFFFNFSGLQFRLLTMITCTATGRAIC